MWRSFGILTVVPWILFAQSHWDMETVPGFLATRRAFNARPEIEDHAEVFRPEAVRRMLELRQFPDNQLIPMRIETIESLGGTWIADAAHRRARQASPRHLYILLSKAEREVGVVAARHGKASRLTDREREQIRLAFLRPFEVGEFDRSLEQGVQAIGASLNAAAVTKRGFPSQEGIVSLAIIAGLLFLFAYQSRDGSRNRWLRLREDWRGQTASPSPMFSARNDAYNPDRVVPPEGRESEPNRCVTIG